MLFGSAVLNFGVRYLLDTLVDLAPPPDAATGRRGPAAGHRRAVLRLRVQGPGRHGRRPPRPGGVHPGLLRGLRARHGGHAPTTNRPFATKYAQQVFGRERTSIDRAFPGDVVGLVNATALRVGDSLYVDEPVAFPPIPFFAPEHFPVARAKDSSRYKQFRRGIEQLDHEGVVQVLRSDLRGDQAPVLAAVGPMQFEVAEHRMGHEFGAPVTLERLDYSLARRTDHASAPALNAQRSVEVLSRTDGELLAIFSDRWRLQSVERELPDAVLEALVVSV